MSDVVTGTLSMQEAHAITAAVRAARNVGLLDALAETPRSPREAARACALDPRATTVLLRVLASLGLVEETDAGYRVTAPVDDWTVKLWDGLEARLRHGELALACDTADGASLYRHATPRLAAFFAEATAQVADVLAEPDLDVLDLGAGSAPCSLAILRRADVRVTVVDFEDVLKTTLRAAAEAGVGEAFTCVPGDLFEVELSRDAFDLAIVGHVCHLYGDADNRRLIARAHEALRPGGTIAIIDIVPGANGRAPDPRVTAAYDLSLLLRTSEGRVHPFSSFAAWLHETGFEELRRTPLPGPFPPTLIRARKR